MMRLLFAAMFAIVGIGCDPTDPIGVAGAESSKPRLAANRGFEDSAPATQEEPTGSIAGHVWWVGKPPIFPNIGDYPNPNVPRVVPESGAVAGALVMLESDTAMANPKARPPVRVEIDREQIHLIQTDGRTSRIALVNVGDEVEFVSRDESLHVLSARGAAFFGLAFPESGKSIRRRFTKPGLVELSSGAAKFWHRAYIWVCPHSHFALTDTEGRYALPNVPAGEYRLIAWHPNGSIARTDRDPNTGMILRHHFAAPIRTERTIVVTSGKTSAVNCSLSQ